MPLPHELVNTDQKRTLAEQVEHSVRSFFRRVQKLPARVRGYFHACQIKYACSSF